MTSLAEEAPANICASSRGNTEGASVIRNNWAYMACRLYGVVFGYRPADVVGMASFTAVLEFERGTENF